MIKQLTVTLYQLHQSVHTKSLTFSASGTSITKQADNQQWPHVKCNTYLTLSIIHVTGRRDTSLADRRNNHQPVSCWRL